MDENLFDLSRIIDHYDTWTERWNAEGVDETRENLVGFLSNWRRTENDWFEKTAKKFFEKASNQNIIEFTSNSDFKVRLEKLHFSNHVLWHFEEEARRDDVSDKKIKVIKRGIDAVNQTRNDQMERLDEYIVNQLQANQTAEARMHTEPPGIILDRLSIMSLKIFHYSVMGRNSDVETLRIQRRDLVGAFERLLDEVRNGTKKFKIYRQFKTYNDPDKNPALNDTKS